MVELNVANVWARVRFSYPAPDMLNKKDFYDAKFYAFCCQEYEKARLHLKYAGKPKDDYDRFLSQEAKWSSVYFKKLITDF